MDVRENMFVYGYGYGVHYPWQEVSMSMLAGDLWILSHSPWCGCPERCAAWVNPYHRLCRHCHTPRRLRDHRADHPATLGRSSRATTVATAPEGPAVYSSAVQPRGEGRPASEVFRL